MVLTWKAWSKGRRATSQRFSFFYCCCCCMNDNTIFNWISFFLSFNQHVLIQQTCCLQWSAKPGWSDFSVSRPQCVFMLLLVGWTALSDFLWFLVWFDSTAKFITMVTHDDLFLWKNKKTSFFQYLLGKFWFSMYFLASQQQQLFDWSVPFVFCLIFFVCFGRKFIRIFCRYVCPNKANFLCCCVSMCHPKSNTHKWQLTGTIDGLYVDCRHHWWCLCLQ